MTKEEILGMEAGRRLDGLVAKELMGVEVEYPFAEGYPYYLAKNGKGKKVWDAVAYYSTDLSSAWQVVDKLTEKKEPPESSAIFSLETGQYPEPWALAHFTGGEEVASDSTAKAICKAALLAKLEKGG